MYPTITMSKGPDFVVLFLMIRGGVSILQMRKLMLERLCDFSKVIQLINGRAENQIQVI